MSVVGLDLDDCPICIVCLLLIFSIVPFGSFFASWQKYSIVEKGLPGKIKATCVAIAVTVLLLVTAFPFPTLLEQTVIPCGY